MESSEEGANLEGEGVQVPVITAGMDPRDIQA